MQALRTTICSPKTFDHWPLPPSNPPTTHHTNFHSRPHTRHSGGHGWYNTRTDLKHAENRQERTRVPRRGGGERPPALGWQRLGLGVRQHVLVSMKGRWETSTGTHFWNLPTLLLSPIHVYTTEVMSQTWLRYSFHWRVWKTNLGFLDNPGWHNHSRTTLQRSYILHSTLQFIHNISISTHIHR